jgi:Tfp pilus assembly protein PilF
MPEAHKHRGTAHYHQSEWDHAIADLNEAIRLDPHYAQAYRVRSEVYSAMGQDEEARRDSDQAEEIESREGG